MGRKKSPGTTATVPFDTDLNLSDAMRKAFEDDPGKSKEDIVEYFETNYSDWWKENKQKKQASFNSAMSKRRKELGGGLRTRKASSSSKTGARYVPSPDSMTMTLKLLQETKIDQEILSKVYEVADKLGGMEILQANIEGIEHMKTALGKR